jgi:hypothetical protein
MKFTDGRSSYKVNKHGTEEKVANRKRQKLDHPYVLPATSSDAVALHQ